VAADPTDEQVEAARRRAPDAAWRELAEAVSAVEAETVHATWHGGERVTTATGTATQLPYPVYGAAVERLRGALGGVGAIVVFDWMGWDGRRRYRDAADVAGGPAADAVRLVTAILRSERFVDGAIEDAVGAGLLQGAARRLLAWYEA
jgi:hypothetical protein